MTTATAAPSIIAGIWQRLVDSAGGEPLMPEALRRLRMPTLRRVGLSRQKATYVRELAPAHRRGGSLDFVAPPDMADDEVILAISTSWWRSVGGAMR